MQVDLAQVWRTPHIKRMYSRVNVELTLKSRRALRPRRSDLNRHSFTQKRVEILRSRMNDVVSTLSSKVTYSAVNAVHHSTPAVS